MDSMCKKMISIIGRDYEWEFHRLLEVREDDHHRIKGVEINKIDEISMKWPGEHAVWEGKRCIVQIPGLSSLPD